MKKDKNKEDEKLVKLKEYINKYNFKMEDVLFSARLEISDIIFEEHKIGCYGTDAVIIGLQLLLVIVGVISSFFELHISTITCSTIIILLSLVLVNNIIHDYSWRKAKKRLEELDKVIQEAQNKIKDNSSKGDII